MHSNVMILRLLKGIFPNVIESRCGWHIGKFFIISCKMVCYYNEITLSHNELIIIFSQSGVESSCWEISSTTKRIVFME